MSWIKKRRIESLSLVLLSCILGAILSEVALRIIVSNDPWTKTREANIFRDVHFRYDISNIYENDSSIVDYFRNKYGLRDSCTSPAEIDILTIGGSTTDQRYVSLDFTYQSIIERRLKNYIDDFGCVSNAGIDGHSTWGHLFSFEHWFPLIPNLKPKFIILYIGINDVKFPKNISPQWRYDRIKENRIKAFLKKFELVNALLPLYRFLRQKIENTSAIYAHKPIRYSDDNYIINVMNDQTKFLSEQNASIFHSRLQSLMKHISSLGSIPICVTQPHRYVMTKKDGKTYGIPNVWGKGFSGLDYDYSLQKLNDVIFELCKENTLDLYNHQFLSTHFYDGIHTTPTGSREIGEKITEFIITRFSNNKQ